MNPTIRKTWLLSATLLMFAPSSLAAPFVWPSNWTAGSPPTTANVGGTLRTIETVEPRTLNPFVTSENDSVPSVIGGDGLFIRDPVTYEYLPYMAAGYKVSPDKRTWRVTIREGMRWSDGQAITSADWVTTAKLHSDPDGSSLLYDTLNPGGQPLSVTATDSKTVVFKFKTVDATAFETLSYSVWPSHIFAPVYAKGGIEAVSKLWTLDTPSSEIVSAGPWRYSGFRPGVGTSYTRNPGWGEWNTDASGRRLPYLDGLQRNIVRDRNAALASYLAGNSDTFQPTGAGELASIKSAIDAGRLEAELSARVGQAASSTFWQFNFNRSSDPEKQRLFRSAAFRRAMSQVVHRAAIVDLVYGGVAKPIYSGVYPALRDWVAADAPRFEFNLAAASTALKNLGYSRRASDGLLENAAGQALRFELLIAGEGRARQIATIISDEARKIGVGINVRNLDQNSIYDLLDSTGNDRQWDSTIVSVTGGSVLWPFDGSSLDCDGRLHDYNRSGACLFDWEKKQAALQRLGRLEPSLAKRKAIGEQIQRVEGQAQPVVYLVAPEISYSWRNRVRGGYPANVANAIIGARSLVLTWLAP